MPGKRGGQFGNQNARKHGFYSPAFKAQDRSDLQDAAQVAGLNEEIALLRAQLKSVIEREPENARLVAHIASTLARLMRTNEKLKVVKSQQFDIARLNVLAQYFDQTPHEILGDFLAKQKERLAKEKLNPPPV